MRYAAKLLTSLGLGVLVVWAFGAICYDGPSAGFGGLNLLLAGLWLAIIILITFWRKVRNWRLPGLLFLIVLVLVPWLLIKPSNNKQWAPEYARTGWVEIVDGNYIFHNVRNFSYFTNSDPVENWETRTYPVNSLQGVDYFHNAFMGDFLAHPIMSFDFGSAGRIALTIETRREKHEPFTFLGGFYKAYELQYIFADERDVVRVRTNIRNEPMYLYRLLANPEQAREFLLETIAAQNTLRDKPAFYNVISHNCTTSLRAQRPLAKRKKWDIRILANGLLDELAWERGALLDQGLPFQQLRERSLINDRARQADDDADFSTRIRAGLPGFQ